MFTDAVCSVFISGGWNIATRAFPYQYSVVGFAYRFHQVERGPMIRLPIIYLKLKSIETIII
jgi:hypothetical protein